MKNIFKITKDEVRRVLLHIPIGLLACVFACIGLVSSENHVRTISATILGITIAVLFVSSFIYYEQNEDGHLSDEAWKDVKGLIWGLGISGMIIFGLRLGGIL